VYYRLVCKDNANRRSSAHHRKKQAAETTGSDDPAGNIPVDFGEKAYGKACDRLGITQVQRIVTALASSAINLKYRSLGPRGAKALAAALNVR